MFPHRMPSLLLKETLLLDLLPGAARAFEDTIPTGTRRQAVRRHKRRRFETPDSSLIRSGPRNGNIAELSRRKVLQPGFN
jgi:hypothetical protein